VSDTRGRESGLPDKPAAKKRRASAAAAVHAHLRSIDDLVEEVDEGGDSDGVLGKRGHATAEGGGGKRASLNSSSRKSTVRPRRKGSDEPVDWVVCEACRAWRFFDPGLAPSEVGDDWTCAQGARECGKFVEEETFMRKWIELMGDFEPQQAVYKFVLEGQPFTVYELYWAVMSLGGYSVLELLLRSTPVAMAISITMTVNRTMRLRIGFL